MTELSTFDFEVDLTSVCVSSGQMQLPLKMLAFFEPGPITAKVDGEAVELVFESPRRLVGLREHFAKRGLKSNDRVSFRLEVADGSLASIHATCVKRERAKAPENGMSIGSGGGGETRQPRAAEPVSGAVEGVRAVKRVRIPGLPAAPSPAVLSAGRGSGGGARSLEGETLSSSRARSEAESEVFDDGMTRVRAVRRKPERQSTWGREERNEPVLQGGETNAASRDSERATVSSEEVVGPIATSDAAAPDLVAKVPRQLDLSELVAPAIERDEGATRRQRRWALTPRINVAPRVGNRHPHTSGPSGVEVRVVGALETADALPAISRDSSEQGIAGEVRPGNEALAAADPIPPEVVNVPVMATAVSASRSVAAEVGGQRPDGQAAPVPWATPVASPAAVRSDEAAPRGPIDMVAARAPVDAVATQRPAPPATGLIDDADFGGDYIARVPEPGEPAHGATAKTGSIEDDIRTVEAYLRRPQTPAIVRSDVVAEVLSLGSERAERALERISEKPDFVSRIRRGAYMVRRQKH